MDSINKRLFLFLPFAALILLGLLVYSNILHAPFVFDDQGFILDNMFLRDLSNFRYLSGTRYLAFLSFAVNYAIGGYDTFGYHLVNVVLHISNSIILYLIVLNIFGTPALRGRAGEYVARGAAFTAALLFVAHPVQTEAVAFTTQRFASLAAFFYLLSVFLFIRARISLTTSKKGGGWLFYALSLVFALAAQKTKEISFTLPAVIVLVEFTFFNTGERPVKRLSRLVPFILLFVIIPLELFTSGAAHEEGWVPIAERVRLLQVQELATLSRHDYLLTQFRVLVTYMRLIIFPAGQNLDYDYPVYRSFFDPAVFISFFFVTGVFFSGLYLLVRGLREKRALEEAVTIDPSEEEYRRNLSRAKKRQDGEGR
ncbi:MAG: hypothetical protein ACE5EB_02615 [Thermodesulfobacteriota bacterium]